ncbi:MAG: hypothetical protein ACOYOH_22595, partial [Paracraurococcus sp.]
GGFGRPPHRDLAYAAGIAAGRPRGARNQRRSSQTTIPLPMRRSQAAGLPPRDADRAVGAPGMDDHSSLYKATSE